MRDYALFIGAHWRETHTCMAESLSALVMNAMEDAFSPNIFAAGGSLNS